MNKVCLIIPVLNEEKNISKIYSQIKKISIKLKILFIDDNSTDNTKNEIFKLKKKNKNIFYILRKNKIGIGSAHKDAIKWCYSKKFSTIITMDCDGTHNPKYIPRMLEKSKLYDIIITSRFKKNNSISGWPWYRKIITILRLYITKIVLNINYDTSGAYRCFNCKKISLKEFQDIKSNHYDFFFESIYVLHKKNYSIYEVPIDLPFRKLGKSKMEFKHIIIYFLSLIRLRFLKIL